MQKKIILVILTAVVLSVFSLNMFRQYRDAAVLTVEQFFQLATTGETAAAEKLLSPDAAEPEALLGALSVPGLFRLTSVSSPRFQSFSQATVSLSLEVKDTRHKTEVKLERLQGSWKITSFPSLELSLAALVLEVSGDTATLLDGSGSTLRFALSEIFPAPGDVGHAVAIDGVLVYYSPWEKTVLSKLLTVTGSILEDEQQGFLNLADNVALFRLDESGARVTEMRELILGMTEVTIFTDESRVQAVLMPERFILKNIRVALNTTGFAGISHSRVGLSAGNSYTLEDRIAGISHTLSPGTSLDFTPQGDAVEVTFPSGEKQVFTNRLFILPAAGEKIRVETIRRGNPVFTPAYRGHLEIRARDGELLLVNEVSLEEYLYSVVPSEMPLSFGSEALKVQAVAARSYAVSSIMQSGLRSLSAHVDDSTASQVYNNIPEDDTGSRAVRDTSGLVAVYDGEIVDARFFSTSSGVTANFEEVWHDRVSGAFPATPVPYLISRPQLRSGTLPDVATEDGARAFFATGSHDAYDFASPWFRWQVSMSRRELEESINRNLAGRYQAQPSFVLTLEDGRFVSREIGSDPLGDLLELRVISRGRGGNIMELELVGQNGTFRLIKELNIRFTLRPVNYLAGGKNIELVRHDGSRLNNYTILPSTYLVFDIMRAQNGDITGVNFYGGGNGHGVGMSQWGARGLAADGKTFREILSHFYPGSELVSTGVLSL